MNDRGSVTSASTGAQLDAFKSSVEEEKSLFHFSWYMKFSDSDIQASFESRNSERKFIVFGVASAANVFYFMSTIIFTSFLPEYADHMGGRTVVSCLLIFAIGGFIAFCTSIIKHKGANGAKKRWIVLMMICYYPVLILRSIGFLLTLIPNFEENYTSLIALETLSFLFFMFIVQGMYFISSGASFIAAGPVYGLASLCFLIFFCTSLIHGHFVQIVSSMLQCVVGGGFIALYYTIQKHSIQTFALQSLYERSVVREWKTLVTKHQQELAHLTNKAKEKSLIYGQLAHDIGTPLGVVSMSIDLLECLAKQQGRTEKQEGCPATLSPEDKQEQIEAFDAIRASIASINVLRQSMLDYVKKANGILLKPSLDVVNVEDLIRVRAFRALKQLLGRGSKVQPKCHVDPRFKETRVLSAENWLMDMLLNFISNAVKFTKMGFIEIVARLEPSVSGELGMMAFEVKDSGPGIPEEKIRTLFQPFEQLQDNKGGTGLGLNSVKQKAVALGGECGCFNNLNEPGTTFFVKLPVEQAGFLYSAATSLYSQEQRRPVADSSSLQISVRSSDMSLRQRIFSGQADALASDDSFQEPFSFSRSMGINSLAQTPTSQHSLFGGSFTPKHMKRSCLHESVSSVRSKRSFRDPVPTTPVDDDPELNFTKNVSPVHRERRSFRGDKSNKHAPVIGNEDFMVEKEEPHWKKGACTAMLVDDSPVLLNLYARMLKRSGVSNVIVAENGASCLQQVCHWNAQPIDFIILDNQMPDIRGPEVAREIFHHCEREHRLCPRLYICTGNSKEMIEEEYPDIYRFVKAVVEKPLSSEKLIALMNDAPLLEVMEKSSVVPFATTIQNTSEKEQDKYIMKQPSVKPFQIDLHELMTAEIGKLETARTLNANNSQRKETPRDQKENSKMRATWSGRMNSPKVSPSCLLDQKKVRGITSRPPALDIEACSTITSRWEIVDQSQSRQHGTQHSSKKYSANRTPLSSMKNFFSTPRKAQSLNTSLDAINDIQQIPNDKIPHKVTGITKHSSSQNLLD
mmetsp:Transcript_10221/g.13339  ORF Transcript_10221/g.13339 Transcript_10221/m.13339 type:complete len:1027 (+) Transcript_10221:99-3179(+)